MLARGQAKSVFVYIAKTAASVLTLAVKYFYCLRDEAADIVSREDPSSSPTKKLAGESGPPDSFPESALTLPPLTPIALTLIERLAI